MVTREEAEALWEALGGGPERSPHEVLCDSITQAWEWMQEPYAAFLDDDPCYQGHDLGFSDTTAGLIREALWALMRVVEAPELRGDATP